MTRAELRLEILRIVHHDRHNTDTVRDLVEAYEKLFDGLLNDAPPAAAKAAPKK